MDIFSFYYQCRPHSPASVFFLNKAWVWSVRKMQEDKWELWSRGLSKQQGKCSCFVYAITVQDNYLDPKGKCQGLVTAVETCMLLGAPHPLPIPNHADSATIQPVEQIAIRSFTSFHGTIPGGRFPSVPALQHLSGWRATFKPLGWILQNLALCWDKSFWKPQAGHTLPFCLHLIIFHSSIKPWPWLAIPWRQEPMARGWSVRDEGFLKKLSGAQTSVESLGWFQLLPEGST